MSLSLVGDIGGSKSFIAVAEVEGRNYSFESVERYDNSRFRSFESVLDNFLKNIGFTPRVAVFAVAGPVVNGRARLTNRNWVIDAGKLSRKYKMQVTVVNDVEATGYSIPLLKDSDLVLLRGKPNAEGNKSIFAPGAGLGISIVAWEGFCHDVLACEGGHADFAARNQLEWELKQSIIKELGNCDIESVISGPGIVRLYNFLRGKKGLSPKKVFPEEVSARNDIDAKEAIDWFVSLCAYQAGNLAFTAGSTGGVYIAGGIVPKMVDLFRRSSFSKDFVGKRRLSEYLLNIPVYVIVKVDAALIGAAYLSNEL